MRITFQCNTTETLEYLRMVHSILQANRSVEEDVKAYRELKRSLESIGNRLNKLEAERRNKVCR